MPIITSAPTQSNVDGFYYYKAQATGGVAPYSWSLVDPPLGMTIQPLPNGCAAISWIPKEIGAYETELVAEDCEGRKVYEKWTIAVSSKCNCNSGALAALIQDVKDMIPVDTNTQLTEEQVCAFVQPKLNALFTQFCDKLTAQTAEVQAIINGLDLVTEERVCELIEEKKDEEPTECIATLVGDGASYLHDTSCNGGNDDTTGEDVEWWGCAQDGIIRPSDSNTGLATQPWIVPTTGTYNIEALQSSLTLNAGWGVIALTVLSEAEYNSLLEPNSDPPQTSTGCTLFQVWSSLIGIIATAGTPPTCPALSTSLPSTVTLNAGDRVYITGVGGGQQEGNNNQTGDIDSVNVEVCLSQ